MQILESWDTSVFKHHQLLHIQQYFIVVDVRKVNSANIVLW